MANPVKISMNVSLTKVDVSMDAGTSKEDMNALVQKDMVYLKIKCRAMISMSVFITMATALKSAKTKKDSIDVNVSLGS